MESTRRATRRLLATLLLFGAVGLADAQTPTPAELQGSYRLLPERSDDIASVVKQATNGRSWPVRTLMRDRLTRTLRPAGELRIEVAGEQVAVTAGTEPPVRTTLDSAPIPWRHPGGERMQVRAREGGAGRAERRAARWRSHHLHAGVRPAGRRRGTMSPRWPSLQLSSTATSYDEPMLVTPLHGFDPQAAPAFDRTLVHGTLTAAYTLFDGGERGARVRVARAQAELDRGEAERTRAATELEIAEGNLARLIVRAEGVARGVGTGTLSLEWLETNLEEDA